MVTLKILRTAWMRFPIVRFELPANRRPTGLFADEVTIKEPESPPALKLPLTANWFTNLANFVQNGDPA